MNKPWTHHYDPKMKETIEYPEKSMYEMLERSVRYFPDRIAVSFEGSRFPYKALFREVRAASESLTGLGIGKGDFLTFCLPKNPQAVVMFYAANRKARSLLSCQGTEDSGGSRNRAVHYLAAIHEKWSGGAFNGEVRCTRRDRRT